jgi:hypothetical protein
MLSDRCRHVLSFGFFLLLAAQLPAAEPEAGGDASPWSADLSAGLASGRPAVILFTIPSCRWCHVILDESRTDPALRQALAQTAAITIDAEKSPELAARLGIESFPTILLLDRRRRLMKAIRGYLPAADLATTVRVLLDHADDGGSEPVDLDAALPADAPLPLLVGRLGEGSPAARAEIRERLSKHPEARPLLWPALTAARPTVRIDAAAVLAEQVGTPLAYDPLAPEAERTLAAANWQRATAHAAPEVP